MRETHSSPRLSGWATEGSWRCAVADNEVELLEVTRAHRLRGRGGRVSRGGGASGGESDRGESCSGGAPSLERGLSDLFFSFSFTKSNG